MTAIENCPFCGGEAEIETEDYGGSAKYVSKIFCIDGCIYMDDLYGDPNKAIERWNNALNKKDNKNAPFQEKRKERLGRGKERKRHNH